MRTKRKRADEPPAKPQTFATTAEDFAEKFKDKLHTITHLGRSLDEKQRESLLKKLCKEGLVCSLPSVCYMLPIPFVVFNARPMGPTKYCVDWYTPRPDSLIRAASAVYVGIRLDALEQLQDDGLHVCVRDVVDEPLIATCTTQPMSCIETLQTYWSPFRSHSIDEFIRRVDVMHEAIRSITA